MNPIATPVQPEVSTPPPQEVVVGSGPVVPHGSGSQADSKPFSSELAFAWNAGQKSPAAQMSSAGKPPLQNNSVEGRSEFDSQQAPLVVGGLSVPITEEISIVIPAQPDRLPVSDVQLQPVTGEAGLVSVPRPAGGINPGQLPQGDSSDETPVPLVLRAQKSEPFAPDVQVSKDELSQPLLSRGTTVSTRIGEPVVNLTNRQTAASPEISSLDGFTRQSQYVLSSYASSVNSIPGGRANGVDNGTEPSVNNLNGRIGSNTALIRDTVSSTTDAGEMGTQESGLDGGESPLRDLSLSQHRATLASGSGTTSLSADIVGGHGEGDGVSWTRSGITGERPFLPPSALPQRLQMDITLADESRVQIDVTVQQRHVSAHLVTDQTLLRNLAVQQEGQLMGQLADAGLELKNFGAHVSDHSTFSHREFREAHETFGDEYNQDNFQDNSLSELVAGLVSERGLHFVA